MNTPNSSRRQFRPRHVSFRYALPSDAAFILKLRLDDRKSRFLSPVENDLRKQIKWLEEYKERERHRTEFYYIIQGEDGEPLGLVRLYDFQSDSFSWGSWIIAKNAPTYAAIESALLVYEIAFSELGFTKSHFEVMKGNTTVLKFHIRFGAGIVREDERAHYLTFSREQYAVTRERYRKYLIPNETYASRGESPLIKLNKIVDPRGNLVVGECDEQLPFIPKRFFFIDQVPSGELRGEHAHKECKQFLVALRGSISVILDDASSRCEYVLSSSDTGLYIKPGVWGIQYRYSEDAMLLVLASHNYDADDYIRDYSEFLAWKRGPA